MCIELGRVGCDRTLDVQEEGAVCNSGVVRQGGWARREFKKWKKYLDVISLCSLVKEMLFPLPEDRH